MRTYLMTEQQINQIVGQLEASIAKFEETEAAEVEFQDYCDSIYTCISYWRNQLRELKIRSIGVLKPDNKTIIDGNK